MVQHHHCVSTVIGSVRAGIETPTAAQYTGPVYFEVKGYAEELFDRETMHPMDSNTTVTFVIERANVGDGMEWIQIEWKCISSHPIELFRI